MKYENFYNNISNDEIVDTILSVKDKHKAASLFLRHIPPGKFDYLSMEAIISSLHGDERNKAAEYLIKSIDHKYLMWPKIGTLIQFSTEPDKIAEIIINRKNGELLSNEIIEILKNVKNKKHIALLILNSFTKKDQLFSRTICALVRNVPNNTDIGYKILEKLGDDVRKDYLICLKNNVKDKEFRKLITNKLKNTTITEIIKKEINKLFEKREIDEKALSIKQQRFFGMVRDCQKNPKNCKNYSDSVKKAAKNIKKSDVLDFAKTKHKKLPLKKENTENFYNNLSNIEAEDIILKSKNKEKTILFLLKNINIHNLTFYPIEIMLSYLDEEKNNIAVEYIIKNMTEKELDWSIIDSLIQYSTDPDKTAELIVNKKKENLLHNNIKTILKNVKNINKIAKQIIATKSKKLMTIDICNILNYSTDKKQIADIILKLFDNNIRRDVKKCIRSYVSD